MGDNSSEFALDHRARDVADSIDDSGLARLGARLRDHNAIKHTCAGRPEYFHIEPRMLSGNVLRHL